MLSRGTWGVARSAMRLQHRTLLSSSFSLDAEWAGRHTQLTRLVGGDYEWISAVQKKFIGGGVASAVDVDAAVCIAEQKDQVTDVVELLYKLRHSSSAAELPESAEYAAIRLLLKHDPSELFKMVHDPINYGVFPNEHSACLAIDHFLKRDDVPSAARLSAWVMQQEMADAPLLALLSLYAAARWAELPTAQQTMPEDETRQVEEEDVGDDDMKTFKFPWVKNEHHDGHFDLTEPSQLAGKTLLWLSSSLPDGAAKDSAKLLGAVMYGKLDLGVQLVSDCVLPSVASLVRARIEAAVAAAGEGATPSTAQQTILDKLPAAGEGDALSAVVLKELEAVREKGEKEVADRQKKQFGEWETRRKALVEAQAERVLLRVKAEEVAEELARLDKEQEKLFFFENRLRLERAARENEEVLAEGGETEAKEQEAAK